MDPSEIKSFGDIIGFAIEKEEEAAELYSDMAGKSDQSGTKEMFLDLAKQEQGHKARLQSISKSGPPEQSEKTIPDLKISDYLVDVEIGSDSSYQDVLIFAMKREESAVSLYTDLAGKAGSDDLKSIFLSLADEEKKHKLKLEVEYDDNVLKEN